MCTVYVCLSYRLEMLHLTGQSY